VTPAPAAAGVAPVPLAPAFRDRDERARWVRALFDDTARHYDAACALLALGSGQVHRRRALRRAGFVPGMRVLDLATGTGLVAQAALDVGAAPRQVVGLDPSPGMLAVHRARRPVPLVRGVGEALPFAAGTFDLVTMGYALRHVADLRALFSECRRVLAPGGALLVLEIARPRSRVARALLRLYLGRVLPWLARLWTRDRRVGGLLRFYWETIEACVAPDVILAAMRDAGLTEAGCRVLGGVLRDYHARAPRTGEPGPA
jgi:demethylmenaquinone methyltransferase/2-methoxy-6-polyprenyl-1,4-benzoquinol methylase